MDRRLNALFLCNELAGYFTNCIELLNRTNNIFIKVVYYPVSDDAPYKHDIEGVELINKRSIREGDLGKLCIAFKPDIAYVGGWADKDYKKIAKRLKKSGTVVIAGMDNIWKGNIRQHIASLLSSILLKPYFSTIWVAGYRQYQFARRLGYSHDKILIGLLAADIDAFKTIASHPKSRRLIYAGRFEPIKGITLLHQVFSSLTEKERNGWKLEMIGNGSLKDAMSPTSSISIHDFMQPKDLIKFIANAGGFILPSIEEPWGVVVQEFAAAGKPLILSSAVNSGENYLIHGYNGFRFQKEDAASLKENLIHFFALDDSTIMTMGERSVELAMRGEPKYWVANFLSLID